MEHSGGKATKWRQLCSSAQPWECWENQSSSDCELQTQCDQATGHPCTHCSSHGRETLGTLAAGHLEETTVLLPKPSALCCLSAGQSLGQSLPLSSICLLRGLGHSKNTLLVPVQEQDSDHGEPLLFSLPYATQTVSEKTWMKPFPSWMPKANWPARDLLNLVEPGWI